MCFSKNINIKSIDYEVKKYVCVSDCTPYLNLY